MTATTSFYESAYDPQAVLDSNEFKVLGPDDPVLGDKTANIACAYNPAHEVNMVRKPRPVARDGEVVVHVRATGICGSDVHFWKHGHIGPTMVVTDECGAGHESAGEVIEVGPGVTDLRVGDRVAIEAGVPCSRADCDACRTGRYNACPRVVFFSTPPYHGTLTRFHAHPAAWLHRLPANMSYEEGALCEPLSVALAGMERAGVRLGDPVVICGAGPIGAISLLAAHAAGCYPLVITDLFSSRLEFARSLVPTVKTVQYPFGYCSANEIDLQFQYRYANQYPKAIRLVSGGLINLKPLVTHRFPLEKAVDAFQVAADPSQGAIKVQIVD
ncbi:hypothetical protein CcaverHIS002_0602390 [Cutaneotrichosporon cavernicola]|uniref:Alcohol dehydrogenase-like N-terminal domain-containing protein n=1 Tax=Cutaneotrichosporon cavernicola TaxID=279322 RepID=A0AA48L860_9TREE|nr:uncharacterized protein CcaverHIS019_0601880 [Cutaneotrichosporon cavernicola]BEI85952.1 hypothetical protein CcaverHIS002_0602390 [Cutaneotrichosporon cavernicola]BEI93729.1 hypothetical protein CcaverHIS019_0601880 [Cutaneotrichosporon cavernicola]